MAIDLTREELLTLTDATKVLPTINGKRLAIPTLWRWCRKGVRGVQLEYVRLGRRICTSREALNRFANALADADGDPPQAAPYVGSTVRSRTLSARRRRELKDVERRARELGI